MVRRKGGPSGAPSGENGQPRDDNRKASLDSFGVDLEEREASKRLLAPRRSSYYSATGGPSSRHPRDRSACSRPAQIASAGPTLPSDRPRGWNKKRKELRNPQHESRNTAKKRMIKTAHQTAPAISIGRDVGCFGPWNSVILISFRIPGFKSAGLIVAESRTVNELRWTQRRR
jgi:hypothetical protein